MRLQEIDEYRWSGIGEPPETRGKGKERGKKRKVLNRKISEKSGSWRARGMGCPWGLRDLCLLCSKWSSTVQVPRVAYPFRYLVAQEVDKMDGQVARMPRGGQARVQRLMTGWMCVGQLAKGAWGWVGTDEGRQRPGLMGVSRCI